MAVLNPLPEPHPRYLSDPRVPHRRRFVEAGGRIIVCSPCAKRRGITETELVAGAVIAGGAAVVALMAAGAQSISY